MVMSTPASRLQIKLREYEEQKERFERFQAMKGGVESWTPLNVAWFLVSDSSSVAERSYLAGHEDVVAEWSRIAAESVIYYLLGEWRNKQKHDDGTIGPDRWFREKPSSMNDTWVMYFEWGLCWAAVGGHWNLVDKLLTFPEPSIEADDDGRVARGYYLGLATWWKNPKDVDWIDEVKGLRGAGSNAYHLLCDAVAAIAASEQQALERALDQYVKLFVKRRDHEEQFPVAATFLWYVARRKGLDPRLPDETAKYIFVPLEEL